VHSSFVCGQQLFQVLKFLTTHSKIFEKFLPFIFQMSKLNAKFSFLFACSRHIMNPLFSFRGAARGEGCRAAAPPPNSQNINLKKKTGFVDIMISNLCRDFPFPRNQPLKSADD
jgi:hypothetical protein